MSADTLAVAAESADILRPVRILLIETQYELARVLRTRACSFSALGLPVLLYLLFGAAQRGTAAALYLVAGYTCMGVVAACLFGIGATLALERAQGWLDLKRASPMPRFAFLGAKVLTGAAFGLIIASVLTALGAAVGGVTITGAQAAALAAVALAGSIPFTAMGLFIALLVPANGASAIVYLIYLPLSFDSGFWLPVRDLPHWLQVVAPALPSYHLAQLALAVFGLAPASGTLLHLAVLGGFTVLMLACGWITFLRSEMRA